MQILKDNELKDAESVELFNNNGKISFSEGEKIKISENTEFIVPGFIDQHIHGAGGYDVMDNTEEAILNIAKQLVKEGTTSFYPTTMTFDTNVIKEVIEKCYELQNKNPYANILGMHLEGPFISCKYIGAQNPKYVIKPDIDVLKELDPKNMVKIITYAVEEDQDLKFTKEIVKMGIIPSVGHSAATCSEVCNAAKEGLNNFTHFHNASSPHHHRNPGVVTAGLLLNDDNIMREIIVDGIHLHPDVLKMLYKLKKDNLILITDAMRAKGMPDGEYDLGGQTVYKKGSEARLENGVLAGSVLEMNNAVRNMKKFSECPPEEAFKMASYAVAKHLGLKNKGLIKEDYDFDIVMLDKDFNVIQTFVNGKEVYSK